MNSRKKYRILQFISFIYALTGLLLIAFSALIFVIDIFNFTQLEFTYDQREFFGSGGFLNAIIIGISGFGLIGTSEIINVLRDMAMNSNEQTDMTYVIQKNAQHTSQVLTSLLVVQNALLHSQQVSNQQYTIPQEYNSPPLPSESEF